MKPSNQKPFYFPFYVDRWRGGTAHLTQCEKACYLDLLIYQFEHGHIPVEPLTRMNLCRIHEVGQWDRIWSHIADKFCPNGDHHENGRELLHNEMMAEVRERTTSSTKARLERAKKAGKASGNARRKNTNKKTTQKMGQNARTCSSAQVELKSNLPGSGFIPLPSSKTSDISQPALHSAQPSKPSPSSQSASSDLIVPESLASIREAVELWLEYRRSADDRFNPIQIEAQLMELCRHPIDQAEECLKIAVMDGHYKNLPWNKVHKGRKAETLAEKAKRLFPDENETEE